MSNSSNAVEGSIWNGLPLTVSARLVRRFAWQTASIDLTVGDQVVMRTGGVFKFVGKVVRPFEINGVCHEATLEWSRGTLRSFPYSLTLDGISVRSGRVGIDNWWIGLWPWLAMGAVVLWDVLTSVS